MFKQIVIASALVLGLAGAAQATTVDIVVPFKAGGGADQIARAISAGLSELNVESRVFNDPAGSGLVALKKFDTADGLKLIILSSSSHSHRLVGKDAPDYVKWPALSVYPRGTTVFSTRPAAQTQVIGAKSPTSSERLDILAFEALGYQVTPVYGLGTSQRRQGIARGELTAMNEATLKYLKKISKAVPVFSWTTKS